MTNKQVSKKLRSMEFACANAQDASTEPVHAQDILKEAAKIMDSRAVERDKEEERSMLSCVNAFNALTKHNLSEEQGWLFMVVLKMARSQGGAFRLDDYLDGAAYVALAAEAGYKERK